MGNSLREAYGRHIAEVGKTNDKIVVFDADLAGATMTKFFKEAFPDRFFDMGIAEANMVDVAAGFAHTGYIPFVSTFALFAAGRAFEQIRNTVCYENLNVKFALTHSGLSVGEDGGSHQSIEDIALMRVLPHMTVFVPCDAKETEKAIDEAIKIDGPVFIRIARPVVEDITDANTPFIPGKANVIKDGKDVAIISCGLMTTKAIEAADILARDGIDAAVINIHTIKPIDSDIIRQYASKVKTIVTAEEHSIIGGLGSAVAEVLAECGGAKLVRVGIEDRFGKSGDPEKLFEEYGLTADNIAKKAKATL